MARSLAASKKKSAAQKSAAKKAPARLVKRSAPAAKKAAPRRCGVCKGECDCEGSPRWTARMKREQGQRDAKKKAAAPAAAVKLAQVAPAKVLRGRVVAKVVKAPPAKVGRAKLVQVEDSELDASLLTYHGRRMARRAKSEGWTIETISDESLALVDRLLSKRAVGALLGCAWSRVAERLGVDATPKRERQRAEKAVRVNRALVEDRHLAVRIDSLPVGMRFKTPDDCEVGVRGVESVVERLGFGSVVIKKVERIGDYIAASAMVVPLGMGQVSA